MKQKQSLLLILSIFTAIGSGSVLAGGFKTSTGSSGFSTTGTSAAAAPVINTINNQVSTLKPTYEHATTAYCDLYENRDDNLSTTGNMKMMGAGMTNCPSPAKAHQLYQSSWNDLMGNKTQRHFTKGDALYGSVVVPQCDVFFNEPKYTDSNKTGFLTWYSQTYSGDSYSQQLNYADQDYYPIEQGQGISFAFVGGNRTISIKPHPNAEPGTQRWVTISRSPCMFNAPMVGQGGTTNKVGAGACNKSIANGTQEVVLNTNTDFQSPNGCKVLEGETFYVNITHQDPQYRRQSCTWKTDYDGKPIPCGTMVNIQ